MPSGVLTPEPKPASSASGTASTGTTKEHPAKRRRVSTKSTPTSSPTSPSDIPNAQPRFAKSETSMPPPSVPNAQPSLAESDLSTESLVVMLENSLPTSLPVAPLWGGDDGLDEPTDDDMLALSMWLHGGGTCARCAALQVVRRVQPWTPTNKLIRDTDHPPGCLPQDAGCTRCSSASEHRGVRCACCVLTWKALALRGKCCLGATQCQYDSLK